MLHCSVIFYIDVPVCLCVCMRACVGVKESDTGLAHPGMWDLFSDKMCISSEQPLQVGGIVGLFSLFSLYKSVFNYS